MADDVVKQAVATLREQRREALERVERIDAAYRQRAKIGNPDEEAGAEKAAARDVSNASPIRPPSRTECGHTQRRCPTRCC